MEKEQVLSELLIQRSSRFLLMVGDTLVSPARSQLCLSDCPALRPAAGTIPLPRAAAPHTLLALQEQNNPAWIPSLSQSNLSTQHNSTKFHLKL